MLAALLSLLAARLAIAQPFRITFQRERDEATSIVLKGEVFNEGGRDLVDVWITADALDAEGRAVGHGLAFVASVMPGPGRMSFTVKLPRVEGARSFRLAVSSYRYLSTMQSP